MTALSSLPVTTPFSPRHTGNIQATYRQHFEGSLTSVVLPTPIIGSDGHVFQLFYRYRLSRDPHYLKLRETWNVERETKFDPKFSTTQDRDTRRTGGHGESATSAARTRWMGAGPGCDTGNTGLPLNPNHDSSPSKTFSKPLKTLVRVVVTTERALSYHVPHPEAAS